MPEHFGHYELEVELGRGGMGVVYRAYDTRRDRTVAIKRLPKHLSDDATFQERFRRESRMAAKLNEPHIIPIHDFGEIDGQLYLDMRLVEGEDLSNLIVRGRHGIDPKRAVDLVSQVASALTAAHTAGLVHRDIKPSNVIVTGMDNDDAEPFAYLVDFGIARSLLGSDGTALTATTGTVGTLAYMAPERISGESGDSRSDVYSLACVLYECVTGKAPFSGEAFQMMFAHVNTEPPAASTGRHDVPAGLDEIIRRGMAKEPGDRYQTASALAAAARHAIGTSTGPFPPGPPPPTGAPYPGLPPRSGPLTSGPMPSGPMPSGPMPSGRVPSGPMPSGRVPSGPITSGPVPSGRVPSGPITSGPVPSGPVYPGSTSGPVPDDPRATTRFSGPVPPQAPGQFRGGSPTGPPSPPPPSSAQASGPHQRPQQGPPQGPPKQGPPQHGPPQQGPPRGFVGGSGHRPPPPKPNRTPVIIAVIAVILLIIGIIVVIVVRNSGDSSAAGKSSGLPTPTTGSSTPTTPSTSVSTSPSTQSTSPAATAWPSAYAQFTSLIGKVPGDTMTAYKAATCALIAPDAGVGMLDQVKCNNLSNSKVVYYVGRFDSAASVDKFIQTDITSGKYVQTFWDINSKRRGKLVVSPSTAKFADVTSSICALPTFLVQFYADASSGLTVDQVKRDYWVDSIFPNTTPAVCT